MIQSSRLRVLAKRPDPEGARHVLYWMQASQRAAEAYVAEVDALAAAEKA